MAIILSAETRVIVQGITGRESTFWTERMLGAGTRIVAGVTPGKEREQVHGVPVYDTVRRALREHPADASILFVPPAFTRDAAFEAMDAGLKLLILLADGVPVQDSLEIVSVARATGAMVIGPNTPGMATLGQAMLGFVPVWLTQVWRPGPVGLMSRSGTLSNELAAHIARSGYGITTFVGCGGDPVPGTRFTDLLPLFEADPETRAVVMVGEVGGSMEEEVAEYLKTGEVHKPVVAYMAGRTAPPGKRMGHAGAIISMGKGTVAGKEHALREAGAYVAETPADVGSILRELLD